MTRTLYSLCGEDIARPFSPHCWKVVMALHHKGLDFEERRLAFTAIPSAENGVSKTVPILRDGSEVVADSFRIAAYLDEAYPEAPTLFGGEGGVAMARFVEAYSNTVLHPAIARIALLDIHALLGPEDKAYFRESREKRFGKTMEDVVARREEEIAAFPARFEPVRHLVKQQPYLGGENPLFADYIIFGALQWLRVCAGSIFMAKDDPVTLWFERCLDLYNGMARETA
ncbi:glutathione S-transferase family protein [Peteryoungia desertarenae]|uniref:Glutathione S-transferase family protein n=1 Tax=Peteryoungia desertarenae TaxID=1813451 RepID=A0ABX6QPE0_9HYPH|nr:glutathione S-transferase family protein [Peteryoungia desertarenae]QLF70015.1 glutathione S-transferase family protein [Peteryoungia desertarenae]